MPIISAFKRELTTLSQKERRYFLAMLIGDSFGIAAHIVFAGLFAVLGIPLMVAFNLLSVFGYVLSMWIIFRAKAYMGALLIAGIEVPLHQVLAVLCLGIGSGFQYYLLALLVIPFFTPAQHNPLRMAIAIFNLLVFLVLQFGFTQINPWFPQDTALLTVIAALNVTASLALIIAMSFSSNMSVERAEDKAEKEYSRAEELLQNILPQSIANRLKHSSATIADGYSSVTILFSDIVDFTKLSSTLPASRVVELLNELFSTFDDLAQRYGLEKIKTIGDSYMIAAGVPDLQVNHAQLVAEFALDMMEALVGFNERNGHSITMRVGMNSGPVVAGVIGKKKFIYDLWGDTVNLASRMESNSTPGSILVTDESYLLLKDHFRFAERGCIEIKGKGCINTWVLQGRLSRVDPTDICETSSALN